MRFEDKRTEFILEAYGMQFPKPVARNAKYVAINSRGQMLVFGMKPTLNEEAGEWQPSSGSFWDFLPYTCHFDEGDDWKATLVAIQPNNWVTRSDLVDISQN